LFFSGLEYLLETQSSDNSMSVCWTQSLVIAVGRKWKSVKWEDDFSEICRLRLS